jgi:hypothetical protein
LNEESMAYNRSILILACVTGTLAAGITTLAHSIVHAAGSPGANDDGSATAESSGNLSERLDRSGGVLAPPKNVDPAMPVVTPRAGGNMPVIPPPGTPGGNPNVVPK